MVVLLLLALQDLGEIREAFREGRHADVVALADKALAAKTLRKETRAEILFWKGTSLARLGRYEEAVAAVDAARELGFNPAELHLERALALHQSGRKEEAKKSFEEAEKLAKDDPERLADIRRRWREGTHRVEIRLTGFAGYDSNLFQINDEAPLVDDVNRESPYYGALLSVRAILVDERPIRAYVDFQSHLRAYTREPDFSFSDNLLTLAARMRHPEVEWLSAQAGAYVGESFLFQDGHFRTQRGALATLLFHPVHTWELRLSGEVRGVNYYDLVPDPQDRDGTMWRVGLAGDLRIEEWKLSPYASWTDWDTDGSDYDLRAWEVGVSVTTPEFFGLRATAGVGYVRADFDHPHSLTLFTRKREDDRYTVRLTLSFPKLERLHGISPSLSVLFESWDSNIPAWDFERWDVSPSVEVLVLSF